MQDQKTIIGVEYNYKISHSVLVLENIIDKDVNNSLIKFGNHSNEINTILVDQEERYIFSGSDDNKIVQYALFDNNKSIKVVKIYENLVTNFICSSVRIGNIAIFGGDNHNIIVILIDKKELLKYPIEVETQYIYSLKICRLSTSDPKILLASTGVNYKNLKLKTHCIDITKSLPENLKVDESIMK